MGDRQRRWICRLVFLLVCAAPTVWLSIKIVTKPTVEHCQKKFTSHLGFPVTIQSVLTPSPWETRLNRLRLSHPEIGTLVEIDQIQILTSGRSPLSGAIATGNRWHIPSLVVYQSSIPFLSRQLHDSLLRLHRSAGVPISIGNLTVVRRERGGTGQEWERIVLRLKDVQLWAALEKEISLALKSAKAHQSVTQTIEAAGLSSPSWSWLSGVQVSATVVQPTDDSPDKIERSLGQPEPLEASIRLSIHRLSQNGPGQDNVNYLTYWSAKTQGSVVPLKWLRLEQIESNFSHPETTAVHGKISGTIAGNNWTMRLQDTRLLGVPMADIYKMVSADGKYVPTGQADVTLWSAKTENGKLISMDFGLQSKNGNLDVRRLQQVCLLANQSIKDVDSEQPWINYQDMRFLVRVRNQLAEILPWVEEGKVGPFDGEPLVKHYDMRPMVSYVPNKTVSLQRLANAVHSSRRPPLARSVPMAGHGIRLATWLPNPVVVESVRTADLKAPVNQPGRVQPVVDRPDSEAARTKR